MITLIAVTTVLGYFVRLRNVCVHCWHGWFA